VVMMILMVGRSLSTRKLASLYAGLGASIMLLFPFIGTKDPWLPLIYLGMGLTMDSLHYLGERRNIRNSYVEFMLVGGLSYMIIPLSRMCIHGLTGFPYSEFVKHGYLLPILSHFLFGAVGSLLGSAPVIAFRRKNKP
jgi:hypothetical protein